MDLNDDDDETNSVTTIANDDFEFHHHMPPKRNHTGSNFHYEGAGSNSTTTTTATARQELTDDENATIILKKTNNKKFHQKSEHIPTISLSLYESASMNDLDQVVNQSGSGGARLYKKNTRHANQPNNNNSSFNNDSSKTKNGFRRVQSCESILTANNIERSYLDNGGFCEHYDEKVVFVTDFI